MQVIDNQINIMNLIKANEYESQSMNLKLHREVNVLPAYIRVIAQKWWAIDYSLL